MLKVLRVALLILIGLLEISNSVAYAQSGSLMQCAEKFLRARQELDASKPAKLLGLTVLIDPDAAKRQQIQQEWTECVRGKPIPPLTFKTIAGESYEQASLVGKIIVINFWFMGCAPCRQEMPALNRLVNEYRGKDVLFLGFATDKAEQLKSSYFAQNRFDFKIIGDAYPIAKSFFVLGYPTTFVVDGNGVVRAMWMGVGMDKLEPYHKAKLTIDKLLAAGKK
ncbi:TlpA family protein disulfide reductase [Fibrella sp. USSR17]